MKKEDLIYEFIKQELDNIIKCFFGIVGYSLNFSEQEKERFIRNKIKKFINKNNKEV